MSKIKSTFQNVDKEMAMNCVKMAKQSSKTEKQLKKLKILEKKMTKIISIQQDDIPLDIDITEPTPHPQHSKAMPTPRKMSQLSLLNQSNGRGSVLETRKLADLETNFTN